MTAPHGGLQIELPAVGCELFVGLLERRARG
jgi:hypothetical protein